MQAALWFHVKHLFHLDHTSTLTTTPQQHHTFSTSSQLTYSKPHFTVHGLSRHSPSSFGGPELLRQDRLDDSHRLRSISSSLLHSRLHFTAPTSSQYHPSYFAKSEIFTTRPIRQKLFSQPRNLFAEWTYTSISSLPQDQLCLSSWCRPSPTQLPFVWANYKRRSK